MDEVFRFAALKARKKRSQSSPSPTIYSSIPSSTKALSFWGPETWPDSAIPGPMLTASTWKDRSPIAQDMARSVESLVTINSSVLGPEINQPSRNQVHEAILQALHFPDTLSSPPMGSSAIDYRVSPPNLDATQPYSNEIFDPTPTAPHPDYETKAFVRRENPKLKMRRLRQGPSTQSIYSNPSSTPTSLSVHSAAPSVMSSTHTSVERASWSIGVHYVNDARTGLGRWGHNE
ncbi:hypothetical protein K505DRAFT_118732 [Melanomma pulvis-pyrius CBS 109.77]|uniref:Uncharacterized protein n=1 Tax=Melanomma pulvis-pyrius CBS 109.77 TaxID=1314802 RepID=A0A6A6WV45_9PLEO|nr:hypothetical protein K505DRAFT_118732 [Melanomma pulvis-pyrius CBS 109.77]